MINVEVINNQHRANQCRGDRSMVDVEAINTVDPRGSMIDVEAIDD